MSELPDEEGWEPWFPAYPDGVQGTTKLEGIGLVLLEYHRETMRARISVAHWVNGKLVPKTEPLRLVEEEDKSRH